MSGTVKRWAKKLLLVKIESTQGTDSSPTAGSNAIWAMNVNLSVDADSIERTADRSFMGSRPHVLLNKRMTMTFDVELAGSGTAGTAPPIDPILRGAAMAVTNVPATSDTYDPVSESFESVTIYLNIDGTEYQTVGAFGNVVLNVSIGDFPKLSCTFTGEFVAVSDNAITDGTYTAFQQPVALENANVSFTAGGTSLDLRTLSLDLGVQVNPIESSESRCMLVADRAATGSMTIWTPPVATYNPQAIAVAHTDVDIALVIGTAAGNICTVNIDQARYEMPQPTDDNGVSSLSIGFKAPPSAGDDDYQFVFT